MGRRYYIIFSTNLNIERAKKKRERERKKLLFEWKRDFFVVVVFIIILMLMIIWRNGETKQNNTTTKFNHVSSHYHLHLVIIIIGSNMILFWFLKNILNSVIVYEYFWFSSKVSFVDCQYFLKNCEWIFYCDVTLLWLSLKMKIQPAKSNI